MPWKPPVPKVPVKKKKKKPKKVLGDNQINNYSHIYDNFYEIFNGYIKTKSTFDPSQSLREMRNLYANFLSLMDSNILFSQKYKFEAAPLEKTYEEYWNKIPNHYMLTAKNLNDIELEIKNRDKEMMMQAMA